MEEHSDIEQMASYFRFLPRALKSVSMSTRPLAYSSEVGESFRHISPYFTASMYSITFCYIGHDIYKRVNEMPEQKIFIFILDLLKSMAV